MCASIQFHRSEHATLAWAMLVCFAYGPGCGKQQDKAPADVAGAMRGVLVVDGNSWTQSRHGAVAVPENVWNYLGRPEKFRVIDEAESGIGMAQMIDSKHQQRVDEHVAKGQSNVLMLWEGCHDLVEGHSAEDTAGRLRDYCERRRAAGFVVVTLTLLPCRADDWPTDYASRRDTVNKMILASPTDYGDVVIDVSDVAGPEQFSPIDKVHLTDAASAEVAKRVAAAMRPILSKRE